MGRSAPPAGAAIKWPWAVRYLERRHQRVYELSGAHLPEKIRVHWEPDLVGVGFVLNDLHHLLHTFKVEDGRIVGENYDFTPQAVASVDSMAFRLARQSHFLVWLRRSLAPAINNLPYRVGRGFAFDYRPDMNTAWKDSPWLTVKSQLDEMRALGIQHGFGLFMVVFPIADQYRPAYLAANREYVLKPQQQAADLCAQMNMACLDLYPALNPTYFLEDGIHLTAAGRQRVAEEVAAFLVDRHLIPRAASSEAPLPAVH